MDQVASPFEALQEAVRISGSQSAFARMCEVSQPAVWKWLTKSKQLPPEKVLIVERETGVSKHLLRPDIYPADAAPVAPSGCPDASVALGGPIPPSDRPALLHRNVA